MSANLTYSINDRDGIKIINLNGSITVNTSRQLMDLIDTVTLKSSLVVNMDGIALITSSGLNTLVSAGEMAKERKKRLILCRPPESMHKLIDVLDFHEYFIVVNTIEEGVTKINYYV